MKFNQEKILNKKKNHKMFIFLAIFLVFGGRSDFIKKRVWDIPLTLSPKSIKVVYFKIYYSKGLENYENHLTTDGTIM